MTVAEELLLDMEEGQRCARYEVNAEFLFEQIADEEVTIREIDDYLARYDVERVEE